MGTSLVSQGSPGDRHIRHLMIISRYHYRLYEYVRARFAREDSVEVILDRRCGRDRRGNTTEVPTERRAADRRVRPHVDDALRLESMQFVTISRGPRRPSPRADAVTDRSL